MVHDVTQHPHNAPGRAWSWLLACLLVLCAVSPGSSQDAKPDKPVVCRPDGRDVHCDLRFESFFDDPMRKKLKSGFINRFLYRVYVRRASDGEPVSLAALRLLEIYELWDEVYYVYTEDGQTITHKTDSLDQAVKHLTRLDRLLVAEKLPKGRYYADVFVELNPISEAEEAEIRSWIARSRGGQQTFATGDRSFFGTFVSLFINIKPGKAERTFRVQTAPFDVP